MVFWVPGPPETSIVPSMTTCPEALRFSVPELLPAPAT
jgi:hypothetical protein